MHLLGVFLVCVFAPNVLKRSHLLGFLFWQGVTLIGSSHKISFKNNLKHWTWPKWNLKNGAFDDV
jgi:hypothetical protein